MTLQTEEILIAGTGTLWIAPEGVTLPTHLTAALDPDFVEAGYLTDDGAKFTDGKTTNSVRPWQSFYPVRVHVTERTATLEVTFLQWNADNMIAAYGGGGFTQPRPGEYRYHPPSPDTLAVNALVLDMSDGERNFRICVGRAFVTSSVESTFAKTGPALLPTTYEILANGNEDPWTIDSDDPSFAPPAS